MTSITPNMDQVHVRPERPEDVPSIRGVVASAFAAKSHLRHKESDIVDALRAAGDLSISLIACQAEEVVGHIAISPVLVDWKDVGWQGLGPVSVLPRLQGIGIGSMLVREALTGLEVQGGAGCVVAGRPDFYGRFGFEANERLKFDRAPAKYFMRLVLKGSDIEGRVTYHEAFVVD